MLEALRQGITAEFPNLVVQISSQGDALQLQGEGLFETNESSLKERPGGRIVRTIAADTPRRSAVLHHRAPVGLAAGMQPALRSH